MCELCDLREKLTKKREQYSFCITQMQNDARQGRMEQAKKAQREAKAAFAECLDLILEHAQESAKRRPGRIVLDRNRLLN